MPNGYFFQQKQEKKKEFRRGKDFFTYIIKVMLKCFEQKLDQILIRLRSSPRSNIVILGIIVVFVFYAITQTSFIRTLSQNKKYCFRYPTLIQKCETC